MSKGKLIVLEGLDGSGKGTQAKLLAKHLTVTDHLVREITFPDYDSDSSALVKMYLAGQFGDKPTMSTPMRHPAFMRWTAMRGISRIGASSMRKAAS